MPFYPPAWVPALPFDPPDSIPISEFLLSEAHHRAPLAASRPPFVCGLTGKAYTAAQVRDRVEWLARGLAKELGWRVNGGEGDEWGKVAGVFSVNTLDTLPLTWATHRLGGISTPANAAYNAAELAYQLENSKASCLFTCAPLLDTALEAAGKVGIPRTRVYLLALPDVLLGGKKPPAEFKTVDRLIEEGKKLPELERLRWKKGEGARRTALLCYSSGTSGLPKGVMISHRNVIANTLQTATFESPMREKLPVAAGEDTYHENALGLLPMSHIYALVVVCHVSAYRGDSVIVLPRYEFGSFLNAIQTYKINTLYVVPPIIIQITKNASTLSKYDLSSVSAVYTGAAPLGAETAHDLTAQFPSWVMRQAYGMTETSTLVSCTSTADVLVGSSGSLISGVEARIVKPDGGEVSALEEPGELWIKGPAVTLGYLGNEKATRETYHAEGGDVWLRSGDEALFRKSENGNEHLVIVDRIKELIKVKGYQVAPAELEAHILTHPSVNDCTVIPVPDDAAGEVPKAYVVPKPGLAASADDTKASIARHVQEHKAQYKWLKGGVEFIEAIPKSPSGKILRRLLRDKDREERRRKGPRL